MTVFSIHNGQLLHDGSCVGIGRRIKCSKQIGYNRIQESFLLLVIILPFLAKISLENQLWYDWSPRLA